MLDTKVVIEELPTGGDDNAERRIFSSKGEMAQILNRTIESCKHLVYWDLNTALSGQERGHHYHARKVEHFYILTGEMELLLEDLDTPAVKILVLKAGTKLTISPRTAHAFRARVYSQALEYSSEPYDPSDTYPHKVAV